MATSVACLIIRIVIASVLVLLMTDDIDSQVNNPHNQDLDKWNLQLIELKMVVTSLDSKFSELSSKVSNFQVMEYAFQLNSADSRLRNIESKANQMDAELKNLKDNSSYWKSGCPERLQIEKVAGISNQRINSEESKNEHNYEQGFEDYIAKAARFHQMLEELAKEQKTVLVKVQDLIKTGYSKLYEKLEKYTDIEDHVSQMTHVITGLPVRLSQLSDQLFESGSEIAELKNFVLRNEAHITRTRNDKRDYSTLSHLAEYVLSMGQDIKRKVSRFENLKKDLVWMSNIKEHVKNELSNRNGLLELTWAMEEISNKSSPLLQLLPSTFSDMNSVLHEIRDEIERNSPTCGYRKIFSTELNKVSRTVLGTQSRPENVDKEEEYNEETTPNEFRVLPKREVAYLRRCTLLLDNDKPTALSILGDLLVLSMV